MREAMEAQRLDAIVLQLPENVLLLSGFWPMIGAAVLLFPREQEPLCIAPLCYRSEVEDSPWRGSTAYFRFGVLDSPDRAATVHSLLRDAARGKEWKRIGYEAAFPVIAPSWNTAEVLMPPANAAAFYGAAFDGADLVDASSLLQTERRRKTAGEIEKLRIAGEISAIGLDAFQAAVEPGISGVELAALVEREIMVRGTGHKGAVRVRAFAQVAVGADECAIAYRPNEISTARHLQSGDLAVLELGVVADGYWADRTRVRAAGGASEAQHAVFETVRKAQEAAIAVIRPGIRASEVDRAARSVIADAGYREHFPHVTGHGLGFAYHEFAPILAPDSADTLETGMLTSVEPGIYLKSFGGVRLEDDVLVTPEGAEILGPYPKAL